MENLFRSRLFVRVFTTTTLAIVALFVAMYLASVPFIEASVGDTEVRAARAALDNVFEMLDQTEGDLEIHRQSILSARKTSLRDIIAVAESRAGRLEAEIAAGRLSRPAARQRLLAELRDIRYGQSDYVWAADYRSVLVSHPDPALNNADFSEKRDVRGNLIVPPMVAAGRRDGEGYHSYWWRRLGDEAPIEKLSFFRHLPAFELVIGTGVYVDDIDQLLKRRRAAAMDHLRARLRQISIARTGYMYVFDGQQRMLIHPNPNIENTNFANLLEPERGIPLAPLLMAVADRPEGLRYRWDHPADPGRYVYEKISWVRHFEATDWYVASSVYVDELKESATVLKERLLTAFLVTLAISIALIYLFVKRLVDPLAQLGRLAQRVEGGDLDARCELKRDDEIGLLAAAFDGMVGRLRDNIQNLDAKVEARTAEWEMAHAERQQAEALLSESEDYNKMLFRESQLAMVVLDPDAGFIDCNPAALRILGFASMADALGKGPLDASAPTQYDGTDSATAAKLHMRNALDTGSDVFCWRNRRPDGEIWDALVHLMHFNFRGRSLLQYTLQDITEQMRAEEARRQLDQAKTDFLSTVSHELRTPMTSVVGFTRLVRKKLDEVIFPNVAASDKCTRAMNQVRGNLDIIVAESERLTLLINDVLDSAKLEAGKVEWSFIAETPALLIERAVATTGALVDQKGLHLIVRNVEGLPAVRADPPRIQQVLINLLSNAIKFTPEGDIVVEARLRDDLFVEFAVSDAGIGIASADIAQIFEKFKQIGDTLTDKPHGTGLGLSICRQIVEGHGGRIWVESVPGQGSTFRFTLPVAAAREGAVPPTPTFQNAM